MIRSVLRSATIAVAMLLSLSACGGGNTSDPASTVTSALNAAESDGIRKLTDYACAAKKSDIAAIFGAGDLSDVAALGPEANAILDAVKMDFQDLKATETSRSGDKATVHLTGKVVISVDEGKIKEYVKKALENAGQPTDDDTVNAIMAQMGGALSQSQDLDKDVNVIQEGGQWLIC